MVEMKVAAIGIDGNGFSPVVLLKDVTGKRFLPIWIGIAEATSIAVAMDGKKLSRPLSHDVLKDIIGGMKSKVLHIIITALKDSTFFAKIRLQNQKSFVDVDARPSDSIALAIRVNAPIFVEDDVIEQGGRYFVDAEISEEEQGDAIRSYLQKLSLEDFGKFEI